MGFITAIIRNPHKMAKKSLLSIDEIGLNQANHKTIWYLG